MTADDCTTIVHAFCAGADPTTIARDHNTMLLASSLSPWVGWWSTRDVLQVLRDRLREDETTLEALGAQAGAHGTP